MSKKVDKKKGDVWLFILIIVIVLAAVYFFRIENAPQLSVTNFRECADAGFPIMESSPRRCTAYDQTFVEDTSNGTYCTPESRNAEACTAIYNPVCGWNDPEQVQCIRYPCAQTYSNSCIACMNENVQYWTLGQCPA